MSRHPASLVIPGRNCAKTIRACLDAALAIRDGANSPLAEIIFVDDGSSDDTAQIVAEYPVRCVPGAGAGPGAARNRGWRTASHDSIWFIDSDCVARHDALDRLLEHWGDAHVAGVGGSYDNMCPQSTLACLIHEEIMARHDTMNTRVDFLGGFNVLYQRAALERVGGFDEFRFNGPGRPGAEDAELAYRLRAAGYELRFERASRVGHFHPTSLRRYLRAQSIHGSWRVNLHLIYRRAGVGDSYSNLIDHTQPPLAAISLPALLLAAVPGLRWLGWFAPAILFLLQVPLTWSLLRRMRSPGAVLFAPLGFIRAYARAWGMSQAVLARLFGNASRAASGADPT